MQPIVADIRMELATAGVEFTTADLDEILNTLAYLANLLGGYAAVDCGEFWGLDIQIDPTDPEKRLCSVSVFYFDEEDSLEEDSN